MIMRYKAFNQIGGFDENFFLYLEDADITRRMATLGRAIHLPIVTIVHNWGRGNHRNIWLTIVNIHSAWIYFHKWGIKLK
jgi:GT2 family glycosyltransferase